VKRLHAVRWAAVVLLLAAGCGTPDVVQANQGRPIMGQLVEAGILRSLDEYADAYGWDERYPEVLLDLNRFSPDGEEFGDGNLYGLSQTGEIVGVFYNEDKVEEIPLTLEEFEAQLEDAKRDGDVPIQFGNLDRYPGIHNYETLLAQTADKDVVRDFVFARNGASFDTPEFHAAAAKLKEWADAGYFTPSFAGTSYDTAWQRFGSGEGRFLIAGTWLVADLQDALGEAVGFFPLPSETGGDPVALGGEGLPFTITQRSKHPDVAAAYIDHLTDANATVVLAETGNLPAPPVPDGVEPPGSLLKEVFASWESLQDGDGLIPYLDYVMPTAFDDVSGAIQRLLAGEDDPAAFIESVQSEYERFLEGQ